MRAGLLVVVALHASARVDVATAQTAEELFRTGNTRYGAGKFAAARTPYSKAATRFGHAGSQYRLGHLHWFGQSVVPNKTEGVRLYTLASAQGYDRAHARLGAAFAIGDGGLALDPDEAVRLHALGAARGEMVGLTFLGNAHRTGLGPLTTSMPAALGFYERAARQGYSFAQYNVAGRLYGGGGGVDQDDKMGLVWMQLAAAGGHADAKKNLPYHLARCTGACRTQAEALVKDFVPQDACKASRFDRANLCSGSGAPTPE